MRIGLMLRAYGEKGGIGGYTRNLVQELLRLGTPQQFVLFFQDPSHLGQFARHRNVTERLVGGRYKAFWDQVAIPLACRREHLDVLLHPKFTAPLLAPCPTVMVVHGADWFYADQARYYSWLNVQSMRALMPLYFRKCAVVISVSQLTSDDFRRALLLPPDKIETIYFGPARHFKPIRDVAVLARVKERYGLPNRFILHLTKQHDGGRKNLGRVLEAYALYHRRVPQPHPLVIGGQDGHLYRREYAIPDHGYGQDIGFPGWIEQADLPAVYSLASLFLYPSNLEAFPIPISEAMACGTPIVTSKVNGLAEVAGDAALLVDPTDAEDIASALARLHGDPQLRTELAARGLAQARKFNWERCARQTLDLLVSVGAGARSTRQLRPTE